MTQEKMRKVITACVSAATVLLVFLLGYLIFQWISLGVQEKKIDNLNTEIARIEAEIKTLEDQEAHYESIFGLQMQLDQLLIEKDLIEGK